MPETIPKTKLDRILSLDAAVIKAPFEEWWNTMRTRSYAGFDAAATFIHALDLHVMAGR